MTAEQAAELVKATLDNWRPRRRWRVYTEGEFVVAAIRFKKEAGVLTEGTTNWHVSEFSAKSVVGVVNMIVDRAESLLKILGMEE